MLDHSINSDWSQMDQFEHAQYCDSSKCRPKKSIWCNTAETIQCTFKINNKFTKDSNKIANKFKFASIIPNPDKSFHCHLKYTANYQQSMFMSPTGSEEVSQIITSLKSNKSSGHDGVSSKLSQLWNQLYDQCFNQ